MKTATIPMAHVGYFDSSDATVPAYDPREAPCPICGLPWTMETVRTFSLAAPSGLRSYFYRMHRACDDSNPKANWEIDGHILDTIGIP